MEPADPAGEVDGEARVVLDRLRGGSFLTILVLPTGMFGVTIGHQRALALIALRLRPLVDLHGTRRISTTPRRDRPVASWRTLVNTYRNTSLWRACTTLAGFLNRTVGWERMPTPLGLAVLTGLHGTSMLPSTSGPGPPSVELRVSRTTDGSHDDPSSPPWAWPGLASDATAPSRRSPTRAPRRY